MEYQDSILLEHDVDPVRGFLPPVDPIDRLPSEFDAWETIAEKIPDDLLSGRLRQRVDTLEVIDPGSLKKRPQLDRAMRLLSFIGNGYAWDGESPAGSFPRGLSIPWSRVAGRLERPMIASHASVVLCNWRRLDPEGPIDLGNIETMNLFLDTPDERCFYLATVAIESRGAPAIVDIVKAVQATRGADHDTIEACLVRIRSVIEEITRGLEQLKQGCDPAVFYEKIRPFLSGWPEPGITYEGADIGPVRYTGGSAAQSSLLQSIDAGLGVRHVDDASRPFLVEMRRYMPPDHRRFVEWVEAAPSLRNFIESSGSAGLSQAYDGCIDMLDVFRKCHMEITHDYITRQAVRGEKALGTGGTEYARFLSTTRRETRSSRLGHTAQENDG